MNLKQLEAFVAVYETGGISRAAERERMAPSVISHHLSTLEAQLPGPLFVRHRRGTLATEYGERLYAHAGGILRSLSAAKEDLRSLPGQIHGELAIGMAYTAVKAIGADLMRLVMHDYPGVALTLSETVSGSTIEQLMEAQIDLALAYNPSQDTRLRLMPLMEERMFCIGSRDILGDTNEPITLDELLRLPFILLRKGITGRSIMDHPRLQKQFERHARIKTDNVNAVGLFVNNGLGCAIGTRAFMREQPPEANLTYRSIIEPDILRTLHLCEHADQAPSQARLVLKQLLLRLVGQAAHSGRWECERILAPEIQVLDAVASAPATVSRRGN